MNSEHHPSAEDVAAYVDGTIESDGRARVEAHVAACHECRREIAEVTAAVVQLRRGARQRIWVPAAAAAAVIAILLAQPFRGEGGPMSPSRFRGPDPTAPAEGTVEIRVLAPREGSVVPSTAIVFLWHAGDAAAAYQLTLTDDEGGVLWTLATTDTVASLPDTIALAPASRYHWYVDGLFEDGQHASSGVHSFGTRR